MQFNSIRKCTIEDIFYCIEDLNVNTWIKDRNGNIMHIVKIRPWSEYQIQLFEQSDVDRSPEMGPPLQAKVFRHSAKIEILKPITDIFAEL